MTTGMIFDVKRYAINDGPGIRTAVFLKGCPLSCWWCHNPEGQDAKPQLMFRANRCKSSQTCLEVCPEDALRWENRLRIDWALCNQCGSCAQACTAGALEIIGRQVLVDDLLKEIARDIPFYDQSGGGVTFTGGEPLQQVDFLKDILSACKQLEIHTAVDTCGYASWEKFQMLQGLVDLYLYDLKLMEEDRHLRYTGQSNRLILDNLQKIAAAGSQILVRMPLIPGVNDDEANIERTGEFLSSLPRLVGLEIMPYHEIGLGKYPALGKNYRLPGTAAATTEQKIKVEAQFKRYGIPVIQQSSEVN